MPDRIQPLGLPRAILVFALAAAVFRGAVYGLQPLLLASGWLPFWAFVTSYSAALLVLGVATLAAVRAEGRNIDFGSLKARLRFRRISGNDWIWVSVVFAAGFIGSGLLSPSMAFIAQVPGLGPPAFFPDLLDPLAPARPLDDLLGVALAGAWWVVPTWAVFLLVFNMLGEEAWFRGYLLPRQEAVHGDRAWLVHGVLWAAFHLPIYPWYAVYIIPTALSVAYVAQKLHNTSAAVVVHLAGNVITVFLPLTLAVARG